MKRLLILLALVIGLTGCKRPISIVVTNNTGEVCEVVFEGPHTERAVYRIEDGQTMEIRHFSRCFIINRAGRVFSYCKADGPIPREFVRRIGLGGYLWRFQVESNGEIFVLPDKPSSTAGSELRQPTGFPLLPLRDGSER